MKRPTLLLWQGDDTLASMLRGLAVANRWLFRQPRSEEELLAECVRARPGVVVLRLGHDLEREFVLLSRLGLALPAVAVLVVSENDETLAGLAWDFGACEVVPVARARDLLGPLVTRLFHPSEDSHAADA